jgi:uroporphyrinogen III methyltransferase/synthase
MMNKAGLRMAKKGRVYLVGAGPGDPGLLTLRAKEVLSRADAVIYDTLVSPMIVNWAPSTAQKIFRGKRAKPGALSQAAINRLLVKLAKQGKQVVRLKGGDPFVFGRGAEEAEALIEAGLEFEVVPGVTSVIAVPAYAGIPVTHRNLNSSFTVVTGHEDPTKQNPQINWMNLAQSQGTLVFLMGLHALQRVCHRLIEEGKSPSTPAAIIQAGTTSRQKTVTGTLQTLPNLARKAKLKPPATVVVGPVVALRDSLQWIQRRPLFGWRVLVTRGRLPYNSLSELLARQGAEVVEIPTIELAALPLTASQINLVRQVSNYDWIIFSSANAIEYFMAAFLREGLDVRALRGVQIACVGEATAQALRKYGLIADLVPKEFKQEGFIRAFKHLELKGRKVLVPKAREGREVFESFLKSKGARVDLLTLYENRVPVGARRQIEELFEEQGGVDLLTFASSSAVEHFFRLLTPVQRKKWTSKLPLAVMGPVTARAARKWKAKVAVQPARYTVADLVEAIVKWTHKGGKRFKML